MKCALPQLPIFALAALSGCLLVLPACRGERSDKPPRQIFPDMDDSPKFKPQTKTDFFVDGRAMRPPSTGTVAFGTGSMASDQNATYLKADEALSRGMTGEGDKAQYVELIPASAVTAFMSPKATDKASAAAAMLDRGQERFNIYCTACHGYDGKGNGMVGNKWSYQLSTFSFQLDTYQRAGEARKDPKQFKWRDGFLFYTIRNGVMDPGTGELKMPSYAHALNERDAWAVVAYIRALQETYTGGAISAIPDEKLRQELMNKMPAPTPEAGGAK